MGIDVWGDSPRKRTAASTWRNPIRWNRAAEAAGKPALVFCASMADVFEPLDSLEGWRVDLFELISNTPWLRWQLLTKRPDFAAEWLEWFYRRSWIYAHPWRDSAWRHRDAIGWGVLPNVWVGASIENTAFTWRADELRKIPAPVRFISAEPLLGSLLEVRRPAAVTGNSPLSDDIPDALERDAERRRRVPLDLTGIDWLICGGESGGRKSRPMHPAWARELRDACDLFSVAFFFKQHGSYAPAPDLVVDGNTKFVDGGLTGITHMRYRGSHPTAGGDLLDGVEHKAFPDYQLTPA